MTSDVTSKTLTMRLSHVHIGNPRRLLTKRTPPHSKPALGLNRSLERCRWCLLGENRDHRPRTYIVHPRSAAQGRAAQLNAAQLRGFLPIRVAEPEGARIPVTPLPELGPKLGVRAWWNGIIRSPRKHVHCWEYSSAGGGGVLGLAQRRSTYNELRYSV